MEIAKINPTELYLTLNFYSTNRSNANHKLPHDHIFKSIIMYTSKSYKT